MQSPIELDDLKLALKTLETRLDWRNAATLRADKASKMRDVRAGLRPLGIGLTIQVVSGLLVALTFGTFWVAHRSEPQLLTCGLLLHGYGLILVISAVRQLLPLWCIDYSEPVLVVQRRLGELRASRLRGAIWLAVTGCLMWVPLLLLIFFWLGVDLWVKNRAFVYWNIATGLLLLGLCYVIWRWSKRPGWGRLAEYLNQSMVGRSIARAQTALAALDEFEGK